MKEYRVTTLEFATDKNFVYAILAADEREAKRKVIASLEAGSKRGDTVYDVVAA